MTEAEKNLVSEFEHHRVIDGEVHHFHHRSQKDTHSRWINAIVSAALVAMLGFFAVENYRLITARIADQQQKNDAQEAEINTVKHEVGLNQQAIVEMRTNQATMMTAQKRMDDKLDVLLERTRR